MEYLDRKPEVGDWVECTRYCNMAHGIIGIYMGDDPYSDGCCKVRLPVLDTENHYYPFSSGWTYEYHMVRPICKEFIANRLNSAADSYNFSMLYEYNKKFIDIKAAIRCERFLSPAEIKTSATANNIVLEW